MPESSLAVAYQELQQKLGDYMGFGRGTGGGETAWDDFQTRRVEMFLKEGLADFYFCGQQWSFLKPVLTLTLPEAANTLDLPDDYGGVEGMASVSSDAGAWWFPLSFGPISTVYQKEAELADTTGRPLYCCVEPIKGTTLGRSTRERLRFWPTADQEYTIRFQYYVNPEMLSGDYPYAWGGAQHGHTILQACKAAAERYDGVADGPEQMKYKDRLNSSMAMDARNNPQVFGWNRDRSDMRDWQGRRSRFGLNAVTIAGVEPD